MKRSRLSLPLRLFIILISVTLLLCGAVLCVWLRGRSALRNKPPVAPKLTEQSSFAEADASAPEEKPDALLDSHTVLRDGKYYRYKDGLINLLLIGVDSDVKPGSPLPYGGDHQADVIILAALDTDANTMTLISVSRDTVCPIEIPAADGSASSVANAQLALSYSYGDGLGVSCKLCRDAVSNLFHGLQIDGYAAFYMGGVAGLNDALGGVSVTILDDYPFSGLEGCENMLPGSEVTLTGEQAQKYIRLRHLDETGNSGRMERQKQYLLAMISQTRSRLASNPAWALSLYSALSRYLLTDLDLSRISYLATEVAQMGFSGDILGVEGESVLGAGDHMELTVDEAALYDLILNVFYEEFVPNGG